MRRLWLVFGFVGLWACLVLTGCQENKPPVNRAFVEANPAYLKNFGDPPEVKKGRGYARVGYLPLRTAPDRFSAVPLYLFTAENQLEQMLQRLLSDEIALPPQSPLYLPFPADLQMKFGPLAQKTLELDLTTDSALDPATREAVALSLAETAAQLPEVERVKIRINGQRVPQMPEEGYGHRAQRLVAVQPPSILMIAGMWEPGERAPGELMVNFDRPVEVNSFGLFEADGSKVEGDYFTSAFQMAVVVHPTQAEKYQDGVKLKVEWDVTDKLGRSNAGKTTLALQRVDH